MRFVLSRPDGDLIGEVLGHGPTLVLLHAGAERRQVWDLVAEILVAEGHEVVTLDLRGHGESRGFASATFAAHVLDVRHLRDWLARPAVYVGASLGGLAALRALAPDARSDCSDAVAGLVLVDVVPDPDPERARAGIARALGSRAAASPLVREILGQAAALRAAARRVRVPTLLVRAALSFGVREEDANRLRLLVPHLRETVIDDCGHLVAKERPAQLSQALLGFLANADTPFRHQARKPTDAHGRATELLLSLGAQRTRHLTGTLLQHLRRTALWLDRWEAPADVRLAGLCHAVYGTAGSPAALLPFGDRARVRNVVGASVEALVYAYAVCDREHLYRQLGHEVLSMRDRLTGRESPMPTSTMQALLLLTLANELDVALSSSVDPTLRAEIRGLLQSLSCYLPAQVMAALAVLANRAGAP